ncbi:hypothetical protein V757_10215 [Pelistega indica]|uniref:Pentapeptide repeat-containing protein n=1 Tax=Pelistega indica TaxID=1414851 RepID=V8FW82_9BURK|nr:pentapeptide repeat-containing protein [Pelistega indica]ETD68420.1 hypothetical protein V757_10215 [Pelistega indica]
MESKGINHEQVEEMLKMVDKSNLPDYALSMLSDMKKQDMLRALLNKKISYQEFVAYQIKEIEKMPSFLEMNRQNRKATRQIKAQYKNKLLDNNESSEQDLYTQKIAKKNVEFLQKHMNQKVPFNHINGIDEIGEKGIYFDKLEETIQQSRVNYLESINTTKSSGVDLFDVDDNSANKEIFEIVDFEQIDNLLLSINQRFLMSGVRIEEANLKHKKLSQGIFRECTFSNCDLSKAQFVGSKFEKVIFQGCNFTEANFEKAVFKECKFINCTLIKLGANLSKFEIVEFIESKISAWNHFRIFFEKLIFEKCYCEDWILSRTFSSKILFRSCHIIRSGFVMGRLEELDLVGCIVESLSVVLVKKIGCLNFNSSTIEKLFIKDGTSIQNFHIDKCNIHYSGLRGIIVNKFYVLNSNLDRNDLSESELLYVSFENSTFKYSMMIRTVFYDFKFKLVDLSFSMMKASKFKQGILHKVSFFSTDLSLVDIDNNTIQERCLTERANLLPKYGDYYG